MYADARGCWFKWRLLVLKVKINILFDITFHSEMMNAGAREEK